MNNNVPYFSYLSDDLLFNIALQLNINDIGRYCLCNSRFNKIICNNDWFWKEKIFHDFGSADYGYVDDWKSLYKNYGSVYIFADNIDHNLGLNKNIKSVFIPTKIPNLNVKTISVGLSHTVAIDFNNNVCGFGSNESGQLGLGDRRAVHIPTKIPFDDFELSNFKVRAISAGAFHTVALDFDNNIWGFGSNYFGQLGLCDIYRVLIPTKIPNLKATARESYCRWFVSYNYD
jgi:hypothetical protein